MSWSHAGDIYDGMDRDGLAIYRCKECGQRVGVDGAEHSKLTCRWLGGLVETTVFGKTVQARVDSVWVDDNVSIEVADGPKSITVTGHFRAFKLLRTHAQVLQDELDEMNRKIDERRRNG